MVAAEPASSSAIALKRAVSRIGHREDQQVDEQTNA